MHGMCRENYVAPSILIGVDTDIPSVERFDWVEDLSIARFPLLPSPTIIITLAHMYNQGLDIIQ